MKESYFSLVGGEFSPRTRYTKIIRVCFHIQNVIVFAFGEILKIIQLCSFPHPSTFSST